MIKIDRFGTDRMIVFVPWLDGRGKDAAKSVHGARWNDKHKGWTYPLRWQICKEIREYVANPLGHDIHLEPAMREWATAEKAKQDSVPDLKLKTAVDLPVLKSSHPKLFEATQKRGFQSRGVAFSARKRVQLLAYEPGLGKTLTAIGGIIEGGVTGLVLVIAPSQAVNISWPLELQRWVPQDYFQIIGRNIKPAERRETLMMLQEWAQANPTERCWVLMNPHWVRMRAETDEYGKYIRNSEGVKIVSAELPDLFRTEFGAIIVDESHETLACATGNAKKWSLQRMGVGALNLKEDAIRMSLSGTPMRGRPENMFGQLNWLTPDVYTSYWKWVERHFVMYESTDGYGGKQIGHLKDPELFYAECSHVMNRVTKEEAAADLPPKRYGGTHLDPRDESTLFGVWLPMEGKQATAYKKMAAAAEADLESGHVMRAGGILAEMTRLKQFAGSCMEFDEMKTAPVLNQAWIAWKDNEDRIAEASEAKAYYIDQGAESQAETIFVGESFPEPEKYERDEEGNILRSDDVPVYKAVLPSNKFDWIWNFLYDRDLTPTGKTPGKGKAKIIIASQFTGLINLFSEELTKKGVPNYVLTGETPTVKRRQYVYEFQNDPDSAKVFLLNTKAGGTALTLDAADDVIICDETFIPDDQLQVEDRAHRLSNTEHQVMMWYLRSKGTLEETIGSTTTERERVCKSIMDGARGLDLKKVFVKG